MATGSTPATRSASSAPSSASIANARWTSTSRLNSVASQTRPGATRSSTFVASSAKANISIVTAANGSTWLTTTRLRRSMRRSLPATSRAIRHRLIRAALVDLAGDDLDDSIGEGAGALTLVAGDDHGRARGDRLAEQGVELVAAVGVESGVRLVEQPQLGAAGDQAGQRGAPGLAGRELADQHVA